MLFKADIVGKSQRRRVTMQPNMTHLAQQQPQFQTE
jgi:hypothetical protein